jgi:hypothetical protein
MLATEELHPHATGLLISVVDGGADTCVLGAGWYVEARLFAVKTRFSR